MSRGIPNCVTCHKPMKHAGGGVYLCQNDQDSPHKNALCELLMKEGIDGRQDEDAVVRTCLLTDLAVELGREDSLKCALAWYEALEKRAFAVS